MRRAVLQIHLWLGLTIGLLWALQGLSGAWLVFHREVESIGMAPTAGPLASLDTIVANARAAHSGELQRVSVADASGSLLDASFKGHDVLVEAATGRVVLGGETGVAALNETLYHFHEELLSGETGRTFIGISGLLLISASLMGLWLGWPQRGSWRVAFAFSRWTTLKTRLYGWHRASGLLACLALVMAGTTGASMIFGKELRALVGHQGQYRAKPVADLAPPRVTPAQAWATAQAQFPQAGFVRLTFPTTKSPVWQVRLLQPGELRAWSGTTSVTIDPADGRVLARYDAVKAPAASRVLDAAFPLHNGEALGLPGRILMILAGLSLPMFYVTGVLAWLRTRRRKQARTIDARLSPAI